MTENQLINLIRVLIDDSKTGLLITGTESSPDARWMTPSIIDSRPGKLYAVTSKRFAKIGQLEKNPNTTWMLQSRLLDKIAKIKGKTSIIDDASLMQEVLDHVMNRLSVFWKINQDETSLIILETHIESADIFYPLKGEKYKYTDKETKDE